MLFDGKRVLITGGTGSLGRTVVRRLLSGEKGRPSKITVFSRDEAKQHYMRLEYLQRSVATDDVIYQNSRELLSFRIGDVRDFAAVSAAVQSADIVINTAALKQVPACEYAPYEAVLTNITGAQNIVRAVRETGAHVELVVGISTDKACKPINVMGMTKAIQERIFIEGNLECPDTRFVCVRYGNVLASRGSVVPLFVDQIRRGGPVTITLKEMTRFLLTLEQAVDTILAAAEGARAGETYVPRAPSARVVDVAGALMDGQEVPVVFTGIRPGEKIHEIMVSEEEAYRTFARGDYYVIAPLLPELRPVYDQPALQGEYSSAEVTLDVVQLRQLLAEYMNPAATEAYLQQ